MPVRLRSMPVPLLIRNRFQYPEVQHTVPHLARWTSDVVRPAGPATITHMSSHPVVGWPYGPHSGVGEIKSSDVPASPL
jgi:hypothetical protein